MPNRPRRTFYLTLIAATVLGAAAPATVRADPTVSELESQIDSATTELESTVEDYNEIVAELTELTERHAELDEGLAPVRADADAASTEIGEIAADLYRQHAGFTLPTMLTDGPDVLADRLIVLDFIGHDRSTRLSDLTEAVDALDALTEDIDDLVEQRDALAEERDGLTEEIDSATTRLDSARAQAAGHGFGDRSGLAAPPIPAGLPGAAATAVEYAHQALGAPYEWGGSGPGYDCSGLTGAAWGAAGVSLPHSAAGQYDVTAHIGRDELQPGDLVFYYADIHHVAIYVGDGKVIHAPMAGQSVQVAPVDLAPVQGFGRVT